MNENQPVQGNLFAEDFLNNSVTQLDDWNDFTEADLKQLENALINLFKKFPINSKPNECQTE